jgi:hypothetical protein
VSKKKPAPLHKRFWFPWVAGAVIVPSLGLVWAQANNVWSAPQKIKTVEEAVIQQAQTQEYLKDIVSNQEKKNIEQDAEIEKQKEISQLQIDSLKGILAAMKK